VHDRLAEPQLGIFRVEREGMLRRDIEVREFTYPGTNLQLVYSIAGRAQTPDLAPNQNPVDQDVRGYAGKLGRSPDGARLFIDDLWQ
jgi:hypothetical protein